nr:hypothetical protein [Anaerolineales bacterium]
MSFPSEPTPAPEPAPVEPTPVEPAPPAPAPWARLRRLVWDLSQTILQAALLYVVVTTFVGRFEIHQI